MRDRERPGMPPPGSYAGETYHGRPALKGSPFDWKVAAYIFLAGIAGSAQIIAATARFGGGPRAASVVRNGRCLALAGAMAGAPFLIADLKTPQRWYNMLRIVRPTSPMSVGSYILTGFGAFSALAAGGHLLGGPGTLPRRAADAAQLPAALLGAGMGVYTASLLSATSTPLWSAAPRPLAVAFAASSMATGAAALSLAEHAAGAPENAARLDALAAGAAAVELTASLATTRVLRARGVGGALEKVPWGVVHKVGALALGIGVPLACHALDRLSGRRSRALSIAGSLALLAGGAMMRQAILQAGNESAGRPADAFRLTQPSPAAGGTRWNRDRLGPSESGWRPIPQAATTAAGRRRDTVTAGSRE